MHSVTALLLCAWFSTAPSTAVIRRGLAWSTTHSPDGASLVYVAETRSGSDSDYTLTLMTGIEHGRPRVMSSLTPRYGPAVESPSGEAIAYRATDFTLWSPAYIYGAGVAWPHPYPALQLPSGARGDAIQWSRDGTLLRAELRYGPDMELWGWQVFTVGGKDVRGKDAADIAWAEPIGPKALPEYMTQRQPTISPDMPIVWGRDSKAVYVADEEGVWRATLGELFIPVWDRIHTAPHIQALAMSPSGQCIVVEAGSEEERDIHELRLGADGVETRSVGTGWGVAFGPVEDVYHYADYWGLYRVIVGEAPQKIRSAAAVPVGL